MKTTWPGPFTAIPNVPPLWPMAPSWTVPLAPLPLELLATWKVALPVSVVVPNESV